MENAIQWLASNWWWITIVAEALISVLNAISKHWSQCSGLKKGIMILTELLSIFTSAGVSFGKLGKLKPPMWSVPPPGVKK